MKERSIVLAVTHEMTALNFYKGYLKFLKDNGWETTVVASGTQSLTDFAKSEGAERVSIPMERDPAPLKDLKSLLQWFATLRKLRPTVLVVATPKASLLGMCAGRLTGVPVRIYQMWGLRLESEHGLKRRVLRWMERLTVGMATEVVCNSKSLATAAWREGVMGRKSAVVLGTGSSHGVDVSYFSAHADLPPLPIDARRFLETHAGRTIFGFVGRIHQDKGIDVLVEALRICVDQGEPVACIIVGAFESPALAAVLREHQDFLPLHISGPTEDPRPYLAAFDVLCLPSKREGFPNVVLEAGAMSIPVIVSDATGCADSVVPGETGVVVETGSAEGLATAMKHLTNDSDQRRVLGQNGREWVSENFSQRHIWSLQERFLTESYARTLAPSPVEPSNE